MDYKESLELLTSEKKFCINLGLDRMNKLANLLSNPQEDLKIIHVAGTNGKGSTCAMLAQICQSNGYKTGLFTSPHLKRYNERIKINFEDISDNDFVKYLEIVEKTSKLNNIEMTEFEILTMMAFLYFKENKTDVVILETGMGGRLDATNIIKKPILTVITSISLDHLDRLGKNIDEIAYEKAGILKPDTPVIISKNNPGIKIIKQRASEIGAGVFETDTDFKLIDSEKNLFSNGIKSYELSLKGIHQGKNLALVDAACEYLTLDIQNSLKNVVWNGRMQYIKGKNLLADAAHNPDAVKLLKQNLDIYYKNKKRKFLFGILNTKDYKNVIENLFNTEDEVVITDSFAHNAIDKHILQKEINKQYPKIKTELLDIDKINEFTTSGFDGIKICCGSFYLCEKVL